jgi:DNA-directed RNA polymerase I, II, and III subunit RPABC2
MYADDYESDVETVQSNLDDVSEADTIDQETSSVLSDDNIEDIAEPNEDEFEETTQTGRDVDTDTIVSDVDVDLSHLFNPKQINDFIVSTHPECLPISYEEMQVMLPITRNKYGIIIDDFHTTDPRLTKYEKARVIGQRAMMIENGAKVFVEVPTNVIDSIIIAEMELRDKKIPFIIKRPLPNHGFEYWKLSDLEQH